MLGPKPVFRPKIPSTTSETSDLDIGKELFFHNAFSWIVLKKYVNFQTNQVQPLQFQEYHRQSHRASPRRASTIFNLTLTTQVCLKNTFHTGWFNVFYNLTSTMQAYLDFLRLLLLLTFLTFPFFQLRRQGRNLHLPPLKQILPAR